MGHQLWLEVHGTPGLVLCILCPAPPRLRPPGDRPPRPPCVLPWMQSILVPAAQSVQTLPCGLSLPRPLRLQTQLHPRVSPSHCSSA